MSLFQQSVLNKYLKEANQEEIDALRNEIANIREENLELQQENANLILSSSTL